ncbi:MAG TPA: hypothetical protein DCK76_01940 [Desulfotomaculum sp.]|nr:MAG: Glycosyltransferase [Desulfotomaculum sp. 46_296]HAG10162.1 hypothetical protein [Desulfotomaculum sp.]HBY03647.1 hypothetical protein [Desulfotomaculum sp.]
MKRLLYISARADFGGGPEHMFTLIKGFNKYFEIYTACPRSFPYWGLYESIIGPGRLFEIPHRKFSLKSFLQLVSLLRSRDMNIVHSHGKGAGIYARLLKIFKNDLRVVHTFHGLHYEEKKLSNFIQLKAERLLTGFTDKFICVSRAELAEAVKLGICRPQKSSLVFNGIESPDLSGFEDNSFKEAAGNSFVVLHISRFDSAKNSSLVLKIAEAIKRRDSGVIFAIVGDGPERSALEREAQNRNLSNIYFLGPKLEAVKLFKYAHVYLSTSLKEGLPLTLIESAAAGVPIIATDTAGNNEVVTDGSNGFLYPLSNPETAVRYILDLKNNPAKSQTLGTNGKKIYEERFQTDQMLGELLKVYE